MHLKKESSKGSKNSFMQPSNLLGICCGDALCALLKKYMVVIPVADAASITALGLDGGTQQFAPVNALMDDGRMYVNESLTTAVHSAGYTPGGFMVVTDDVNVTIVTDFGQAEFNKIVASGKDYEFTVSDALVHGDQFECTCTDLCIVPALYPSECLVADSPYAAAAGDVMQLLADTGAVIAQWVATAADNTDYLAGGAAAIALLDAGVMFSLDGDSIVICEAPCPVASVYNQTGDADASTFEASGDATLCFKVVACQIIKSISISKDGDVLYSGPLAKGNCPNPAISLTSCGFCVAAETGGNVYQVEVTLADGTVVTEETGYTV